MRTFKLASIDIRLGGIFKKVVASHEKEFLNSLADKIIEMREGRIQTDGK